MSAQRALRKRKQEPEPEKPEQLPDDFPEPEVNPEFITCIVKMNRMTIGRETIPGQGAGQVVYRKGERVTVPFDFYMAHKDSLAIPMEPSRQAEIDALKEEIERLKAGFE